MTGKKHVKKQRIVKLANSKSNVRVLGLDCSSSTIGWGVVSTEPKLIAYGHIKPLDSKYDIVKRLDGVYEEIKNLCEEFNPSFISIEDILLFMKGRSQAKTITILATFNRVSALAAYQNTDAEVVFYPSQTIRKIIKNSCGLKKKIDKEEMPDVIVDNLESEFKEIINKKGNVAKETYDEADGIAAAWAHVLELENE